MKTTVKKEAFDIEEVLQQMTLEEKAQMCSGRDFWKTQDIERLGIPAVMMCDGPNGLRKQLGEGDHLGINASIETVCYPTASAMAASFDRELLRELGECLGQECQAEQVGMLLGPGVNIKRSPLCGRNFEYYSEDPYLAGELAVSYIQGLQSQGVAACVKHFAANNQETRRMSGSSEVDERTLQEIYFPAFEKAVKEGKTQGLMCAYNAINGTFCSENKDLLTKTLRDDRGYEGFVATDWGAVKDRVRGLEAGVDLEMPGSMTGKTEKIIHAVEEGTLQEEVLDMAVRNVLRFVKKAVEQQKKNAEFDREVARETGKRLPEAYETEGCDRDDINMPENQNRLIEEIAKVQKNTVVVLHTGSCIALPWFDKVKAVLCMHLGGDQVGKAAVELLYGDVSPSGRLAEAWPLKVEDNPSYLNFPGENGIVEYREGIFTGYRYYDKKEMEVLFPFG